MTSSSSGEPPLWLALEAGNTDLASILVRHGVDTDHWAAGPDSCSQTLLHRAVDENKEEAACFLVRAGCDLNTARRPGAGAGRRRGTGRRRCTSPPSGGRTRW